MAEHIDQRINRERIDELRAQIDRATPRLTEGTPKFLGQITTLGNLPVVANRVYITNPVQANFDDQEGDMLAISVDTSRNIPVVVLGHPAGLGDLVSCFSVGGVWATYRGPTYFTIVVRGCGGIPYPGLTVGIYNMEGGTLIATCTTDSDGAVNSNCTGLGTFWVEVTGQSSRFNGYSGTLTLGTTSPQIITLTPVDGYVCVPATSGVAGCLLPIATTLYMTSSVFETVTLTYVADSSPPTWTGTSTYSYPGYGVGPICASKTIDFDWTFIPSEVYLTQAWNPSAIFPCPGGGAVPSDPYTLYNDDYFSGVGGICPQPVGVTQWSSLTGDPLSNSYDCPPSFEFTQNVINNAPDINMQCSHVQALYMNWGPAGTILDTQTVTE